MTIEVQQLEVGPIVGETTPTRVRLWGRSRLVRRGGMPRRAFGVARARLANGAWGASAFCKMNPNFDVTGVAILDGLEPERRYLFQMGWFFADAELDDPTLGEALEWRDSSAGEFRTGSDDDEAARTVVFGSCRYLLRLAGNHFDDRGDKTFRRLLEIGRQRGTPDLLMMIGDQIYADDLNIIFADRTVQQFFRRYRATFRQPFARRAMASMPTYMTLDDHEIENNWPRHASHRNWVRKWPHAMHAYQAYQAVHGPLIPIVDGRLAGTPNRYWYRFHDGCCDFFVTDTRNERILDDDPARRQMISRVQLDALLDWLSDGSGRVKVVVSAVPFFPDYRRPGSDKWSGFVHQRDRIIHAIRDRGVRKVVVLSGDVHASMSAELVTHEDPAFQVVSVVSSPFFWPYGHPRSKKFDRRGPLLTFAEEQYFLERAGPVFRTDNFARVVIDPEGVEVRFFGRKAADDPPVKRHRFLQA